MAKKIVAVILIVVIILAVLFVVILFTKPILHFTDKDVSYGEGTREKMDIYMPVNKRLCGKTVPFVLLIHGGAWVSGDKNDIKDVADAVTKLGYAAVAINYPYASETTDLDDILDSVGKAVAFIKNNGKQYNIDSSEMSVWGVSAGAHLALMFSYARVSPIPVKFVTALCAPSDFTDSNFENSELKNSMYIVDKYLTGETELSYGEKSKQRGDISPIAYIDSDVPPTIICHGSLDKAVPYSNSDALKQRLDDYRISNKFVTFPHSGHNLDNDKDSSDEYYMAVVAFLEMYM